MTKGKTPVIAVLSFIGGILGTILINYWTEGFKANLELRNLVYKSRADLWKSTAEHFALYISNWDRLRLVELGSINLNIVDNVEECTKKLHTRKKDSDSRLQKRTDRYIDERDKAKDLLMADLEQARNLFGDDVRNAVLEFDSFSKKYQIANACQLPDVSELRTVQRVILTTMLRGLSNDKGSGK